MATFCVNKRFLPHMRRMPMIFVKRTMAGCQEDGKKCAKLTTKSPCGKPEAQLIVEEKPRKPKKRIVSMWENPFCDETVEPCPVNPRFDDLYYVESDKATRRYWQTWVDCPKLQIKPKKICCFEETEYPPAQRRAPPQIKARVQDEDACRRGASEGCPCLQRECKKMGRRPPSCKKTKTPLDCKKPLAPYPAFSECLRLRPGELPLSECLCWQKPAMCEVWIEFRKRQMLKTRK